VQPQPRTARGVPDARPADAPATTSPADQRDVTDEQKVAWRRRASPHVNAQCDCDVPWQGQLPLPAFFGGWYYDQTSFQVDVAETKPCDLDTAQAKIGHAQGHGVIPTPFGRSAIKGGEEVATLLFGQKLPLDRPRPFVDRWHSLWKCRRATSANMYEMQKLPQPGELIDNAFYLPASVANGRCVPPDIRRTDEPPIDALATELPTQVSISHSAVMGAAVRRQASVSLHEMEVVLDPRLPPTRRLRHVVSTAKF